MIHDHRTDVDQSRQERHEYNKGQTDLREALVKLEAAATAVHRYGAVTGPQWTGLSVALIQARAALAPQAST